MAKILLVDDNPQNIELLTLRLNAAGHETMEARNGDEALHAVEEGIPDLMILDLQMPKVDGLTVLKTLKERHIHIPVVVISAFATVERAVEAMKAGALDFITKPFDPTHLELVVERALERTSIENHNRFLTEELNARYHFVLGRSEGMAKVYEDALRAAAAEGAALIIGETGTGKETLGRVIHKESARGKGPFVPIHCAALDPEGQEEEIFGAHGRKGKVELAAGGTLFLEDVGTLKGGSQKKLLGLLTTHGFTRVGGTTTLPADARVICATTTDLNELAREGTFDPGLAAALQGGVIIDMPPLRDRREDIPELVSYFVEKYNRELGRALPGVGPDALELLTTYPWPGNVRELANMIERAVATGKGDTIEAEDLGVAVRGMVAARSPSGRPLFTGDYRQQVREARRQIVLGALTEAQGETDRAAQRLGIAEPALDRLLTLLKIRR
jgi:DNA-binding NtrC family response regulator